MMVVNPRATTTSTRVTDVIIRALSHEFDLEVTVTNHRGHAFALGEYAQAENIPIIFTLGGDGVVNEVVNGLLSKGASDTLIAPIPGGSGNVFVRALGLPLDPVEATGALLEAIRDNNFTKINVGHIEAIDDEGNHFERFFLANAGLGFDAQIINAMDRSRAKGHQASPQHYLTTTIREYFHNTNRSSSPLAISRPGSTPIDNVFVALIQNSSPWTFFGKWALDPNPAASFSTGLDVFIVRKLNLLATFAAAGKVILRARGRGRAKSYMSWHDQREITADSPTPIPLQADGEALGSVTYARFTNRPRGLATISPSSQTDK
jgi:diacylglycerol kinase family enzyme